MASPGLVLPRFYSTDPVDGEKVDVHARIIADQLNAGLTASNIASATRLASSAFLEGKGVFLVNTNTIFGGALAATTCFVANFACRLVGVQVLATHNNTGAALSSPVSISVYVNNVAASTVSIKGNDLISFIPKGSLGIASGAVTTPYETQLSFFYRSQVDLASGDRIGVVGDANTSGSATLMFSANHTS